MKQIPLIILFVLVAMLGMAAGQSESSKEITLLVSSRSEWLDEAVMDFEAENPGVTVEVKKVDLSDGSTLTMDAMLAAGVAPNVYWDYMGRVSKYIVPEFALDLSKFFEDLDDFKPGILEPVTRDGALLGLPLPGGAQGMAVNLDMAAEMALSYDNELTISNFLAIAQKVKSSYGGKRYGTGMFAANQSGDYLYMNWLASFGAKVYEGAYTKTVIESPGGLKTFQFWKLLHDKGYIEKESPVLSDDDYALAWATGKYFATAFFPAWAPVYHKTAIEQGLIKKAHRYAFIRFPAGEGIDKVPAAGSFGGLVVKATDNEMINKLSARLAWHMSNTKIQEKMVRKDKVYPNRKSVNVEIDDPYWEQINEIVAKNGMLDLGLTTPTFSEVRTQMFPRLQALWTGKESPEEALANYGKAVNQILEENK